MPILEILESEPYVSAARWMSLLGILCLGAIWLGRLSLYGFIARLSARPGWQIEHYTRNIWQPVVKAGQNSGSHDRAMDPAKQNSFFIGGFGAYFRFSPTPAPPKKASEPLSQMIALTMCFAALPRGLAYFDSEQRLVHFNPAFAQLLAIAPHELALISDCQALLSLMKQKNTPVNPNEIASLEHALQAAFSQMTPAKLLWALPNQRYLKLMIYPADNAGTLLEVTDWTDENQRLIRYQDDAHILQKACTLSPTGYAYIEKTGRSRYSNEKLLEICGLTEPPATLRHIVSALSGTIKAHPACSEIMEFAAQKTSKAQWEAQLSHKTLGPIHADIIPHENGAMSLMLTPLQFAN